jgi:hypothetical protein
VRTVSIPHLGADGLDIETVDTQNVDRGRGHRQSFGGDGGVQWTTVQRRCSLINSATGRRERGARPTRHRWPAWPGRASDDPFVGEALDRRSCVQPNESRHGHPALGDDDLLAMVGAGDPVGEVRSKLGDRNVQTGPSEVSATEVSATEVAATEVAATEVAIAEV